jgi:PPOX class probable F420-dependent enzyme
MPAAPLPPEAVDFLRQPYPAVVATLRRDGSPLTAVTWFDWDDGRILMNGAAARVRLKHLRRDPRASVTVWDPANFYWQLTVTGRVTRIEDDADFSGIDRLAQRYIGSDYPDKSAPRVNMWMEVESWNGWDPVNYVTWTAGVSKPPV